MITIRRIILIGVLLVTKVVMAEVVVLQSGKTYTGEIVLQNEEIVIMKDGDGHRFQFPRAEVKEIQISEQAPAIQLDTLNVSSKGNCALRLDFSGGALFVPTLSNGGTASVDLQIGSRQIGKQRIFLGGSIGYQAAIINKSGHFLPLMMVVSVPLTDGRHAPEVGAALGYGFALKSPNKGGMTAKLDISWRYQYSTTSALLLGLQTRFQQADVQYQEIVNGYEYTATLGKNFVSLGIRLALQF